MPRGEHPNSRANLLKGNRFKPGDSATKAASAKGNKTIRDYKTFQECFKNEMSPEMRKELFDMLYGRAKHGNLKAFEIIRDTMGEKPKEEVIVNDGTGIIMMPEVKKDE